MDAVFIDSQVESLNMTHQIQKMMFLNETDKLPRFAKATVQFPMKDFQRAVENM